MHTKKQRIISFLMAFLLIFTFAFVNPLTVSQSQAFAFAVPVLTPTICRIITGVLVSSGFIIHKGATSDNEINLGLTNLSNAIYRTLDNSHKILLGALSIIDNVVEVPQALYNSIVNIAKKVITPDTITSLNEQGIVTKYLPNESLNTDYPNLITPFYEVPTKYNDGVYSSRKYDLRDAQPFFIYEGTGSASNEWDLQGVKYFWNDIANENLPVLEVEGLDNLIFLTPDLSPYKIYQSGSSSTTLYIKYEFLSNGDDFRSLEWSSDSSNGGYLPTTIVNLETENVPNINNNIIMSYFIIPESYTTIYSITDIYDKETGAFLLQVIKKITDSLYSFSSGNVYDKLLDKPIIYDFSLAPSEIVTPPVTNINNENVITLPNEITGIIGATSSDVNIGTTDVPDVPDTPNTETMDNINTNVGELVTGGTLGEQVNTNIGSVEGLHGEITEQVDFGAVFDTIAQYISALDISSVTWFPVAVAGFIVPFLPLISLGIILFFIDRVLNGGA